MTAWRTLAHVAIEPPPHDWQSQLATRLGRRPRRLGGWAELALYGARLCLDAAGEAQLPDGVALRVASIAGPIKTAHVIVEQSRTGLPLPFPFMQSQPSQMLAAMSQHLGWTGDARFMSCRDRVVLLALLRLECPAGVLLGWVEEDRSSEWWRLAPDV